MTENQKAIAVMCSLFNGFTPEKAAVYDRFLSDIPAPLLSKAIQYLAMTAKFPPTVAEIRAEAERIYHKAQGIQEPDASRAWEAAKDAISRVGSYRTPKFDDPICEKAVQRFGWKELCQTPVDSMGVARAQFMKMYESIAASSKKEKQTARLLGDGKVQALIQRVAERKQLGSGQ